MKAEKQSPKEEPKQEKPEEQELDNPSSTRMLFTGAPKVQGVDTGVYFLKVFKGKNKDSKKQ